MSRPHHIALISEHASPAALLGGQDAGGQNVYVDEVSRHLAALGMRVDVISRRNDPALPEIMEWAPRVRLVHLKAGPAERIPKDEIWPYMGTLRDELLRFMLRDGARYDVLHANFWMSGWVAIEIARIMRVPTIQTFHALGVTKRRHQGLADTSPRIRIDIEREIICKVDRLIAQCPHERTELIEEYGARPDRITLLPAGVNTTRFHPVDRTTARRVAGVDHDDPLIVYVGRVLPRKDIRNIVRGIAELRTRAGSDTESLRQVPRLLVVGGESATPDPHETPEIGELQHLAIQLGISDLVSFTGQRSPDVLRYYYSAADVVVTTPWYEPFGLTPLEAMACGRPVIGSAVGGLTFTIEDGRTGALVPPRDPTALARKMEQLLASPDHARWMGQQARLRVEQEFTWPVLARRLKTIYGTLSSPTTTSPASYAIGTITHPMRSLSQEHAHQASSSWEIE